MSSSSAYDHAAVTINITCNNMPPNLIAVLCGEIGAQLGLQWSRGLVTSDSQMEMGLLGTMKGLTENHPVLPPPRWEG